MMQTISTPLALSGLHNPPFFLCMLLHYNLIYFSISSREEKLLLGWMFLGCFLWTDPG